MAKAVFVSQRLTQQNWLGQCAKSAEAVCKDTLRSRYGVMIGESDEEFQRNLQVLIHCDSEKTRRLALWW